MKYANSRSGIVHSRPCVPGSAHSISVPADQHVVPECLKRETLALIADKVAPRFTRGKEPDSWRICWDAQSPTEDFLICRHPDARLRARLTLATGGSFHGYK
jgi:sarcosine oxidase/L-pipecolate oxidase